jgi:hypothetical protein
MTDEIKSTAALMKAGDYDWQRLGSIVVSLCLMLEGLHATPDKLPPVLVPVIDAAAPWAWLVAFLVSGTLVKLGKPVFVK